MAITRAFDVGESAKTAARHRARRYDITDERLRYERRRQQCHAIGRAHAGARASAMPAASVFSRATARQNAFPYFSAAGAELLMPRELIILQPSLLDAYFPASDFLPCTVERLLPRAGRQKRRYASHARQR